MYAKVSEQVGSALGVDPLEIMGRSRKHHISRARRACMRVFSEWGKGPREIADLMGLDHSSVIEGLRKAKTEKDVHGLAKMIASGRKPCGSFEFVSEEVAERQKPEAAWLFAEERLKHYKPRLHEFVTINVKSDNVVFSCVFQSYVHNARWHWKRVSQERAFV